MPPSVRQASPLHYWLLSLLLIGAAAHANTPPPAQTLADLWPQVQQLFPQADKLGEVSGTPPAAAVFHGGQQIGVVFLTNDVSPIPAYSGKPVNNLVGFDLEGKLRGVTVIAHQEPILVVGISEQDLADYTGQYAGLPVADDIRIGGSPAPGRAVIDGISGATITAMVVNRSISQGVKKVAESLGLLVDDEGGLRRFEPPEPLWIEVWRQRQWQIALLLAGLGGLLFILLFQDWLVKHTVLFCRIRHFYLWYTLIFIGWYSLAQLSVVNVFSFVDALLKGFSWESFLIDPMMFLLWSFVALVVLLWGRGVYCGWLCPFGALQELVFRLGQRLGLPEWEPPPIVHERLWAIKYVVLLGLFGAFLYSFPEAVRLAEVEPFKTTFVLQFDRPWPFVVYALVLVAMGMVLRKAYCRYLCPLGAALTFPSKFHIFDWLRRRRECGRPCQSCAHECEVGAIRPTGEIIHNECHYCLDCQVTYWNDHKCPPLVEQRKKRELRARIKRRAPAIKPAGPNP